MNCAFQNSQIYIYIHTERRLAKSGILEVTEYESWLRRSSWKGLSVAAVILIIYSFVGTQTSLALTSTAGSNKHSNKLWLRVIYAYWMSQECSRTSWKQMFATLDDNQEQQVKCECFSDLITMRCDMRTRKDRVKQVVLSFWSTVPLRAVPHTSHHSSLLTNLVKHLTGSYWWCCVLNHLFWDCISLTDL